VRNFTAISVCEKPAGSGPCVPGWPFSALWSKTPLTAGAAKAGSGSAVAAATVIVVSAQTASDLRRLVRGVGEAGINGPSFGAWRRRQWCLNARHGTVITDKPLCRGGNLLTRQEFTACAGLDLAMAHA
jgi:hypothetical protein